MGTITSQNPTFTQNQYSANNQQQPQSGRFTQARTQLTTSVNQMNSASSIIDSIKKEVGAGTINAGQEHQLRQAVNQFETASTTFAQDSQTLASIAKEEGQPDGLQEANGVIAQGTQSINSVVNNMRNFETNAGLRNIVGDNGINQMQAQSSHLIENANVAAGAGAFIQADPTAGNQAYRPDILNNPNGAHKATESQVLNALQGTATGKDFIGGLNSGQQQDIARSVTATLSTKVEITRSDVQSAVQRALDASKVPKPSDAAMTATVAAIAARYNIN